ncbi:hypothetical protein KM427_18000 [Nocardioides sp. LMS-CY]|uniref:hypothetical protein n=1 Tax=Nocardioides sp. (strain LMS-CY) TaxID=2840457 RepID=UPI001C006AE4|nr:hypothetical protein [Nocardioides sp. LMS-CY]QWF20840.1 hypothetical protein KM427_18000 [Nocardioides sp. LMS-CY]
MSRLFGPLFSTADLTAHLSRLGDVFGMVEAGRTLVHGAEVVALRTPGARAGAVVWRPDPVPAYAVRDEATRLGRDALRVVDFYAPDLDRAVAHARGLGYRVESGEASYELAEGAFREAHLPGPDGTVTAFLSGPRDFFAGFARIRDRVVSEVCSISLPLGDAGPSLDFYADVLGWGVVYEYSFDDPSFSDLLGSTERLRVRSSTVGPARDEPYLNLVDYGLPESAGGSLLGRSGLDRRGLVGVVVTVPDLDDVRRRADGHPGAWSGAVFALDLPPFGATRVAVVTSPHRIVHVVVEDAGLGC